MIFQIRVFVLKIALVPLISACLYEKAKKRQIYSNFFSLKMILNDVPGWLLNSIFPSI